VQQAGNEGESYLHCSQVLRAEAMAQWRLLDEHGVVVFAGWYQCNA